MTHGVGVWSFGRGLALLWNDDIIVKLQSYDKLHIDAVIIDPITTLRSGPSQVSMVRWEGSFTLEAGIGYYILKGFLQ
jgi:hypothetical protein